MEISKKTRLLVVAPHPDDEALGCGGLIGKVKKAGGKVCVLYISVGTNRQLVTTRTKEETRLKEIEDVKKYGGIEVKISYVGEEFCRLDTVAQKDICEHIEDTVDDFKPTIVALPTSTSYNQDHRAVYEAGITALRPVPRSVRYLVPHIMEYFEPYFWALTQQKSPNLYLDLSEKYKGGTLLDFKIRLYKCHATQVRQDPFPRSPENLERQAHLWGKEIGVNIAEAYCVLRSELC